MNELFFELIQVSTGQLDCLSRGPSPEEWQQLYELSKRHGVTALCYQGVVRLFEFGLRAPQDLSIDWMADAEELPQVASSGIVPFPQVSNPLRRMLFNRWLTNNSNTLYVYKDKQKVHAPSVAVVFHLLADYELYHQDKLTMGHVVDFFELLRQSEGHFDKFSDGSDLVHTLRMLGIWRFARSMMWTVGHTLALDAQLMPYKTMEIGGRFVLDRMMQTDMPLKERLKYSFWRYVKF